MGRLLMDMTDEVERRIEAWVMQGVSYLEIRHRLPEYRTHEVRNLYVQYAQAKRCGKVVPIPEDWQARKAEVQARWTEQDWSRKWVGRYAQTKDTDIHQAASKMLQ